VDFQNVYGLFVPAGVAADVRERLSQAVVQALATPAVKEQMAKMGLLPAAMPPRELSALIAKQAETLVPLARDLRIHLG
jgi:tripartite-type tricarboxylate transporter receptor subunit TctC